MHTLKLDAHGADVKKMQKKLTQLGFPVGNIDGDFGPATEVALLAFPHSQDLLPDGVAGPRTLAALGLTDDASLPSAIPDITPQLVSRMFPATPLGNIKANQPVDPGLKGIGGGVGIVDILPQ